MVVLYHSCTGGTCTLHPGCLKRRRVIEWVLHHSHSDSFSNSSVEEMPRAVLVLYHIRPGNMCTEYPGLVPWILGVESRRPSGEWLVGSG